MKFIKSHVRLFEILFCVFSLFLAVMIALYVAGDQNKSTINSAFGLSASKTESAELEEGEEEEDTEYYPATYDSAEALQAGYEAVNREVEEEGIVLLSNDGALPLAKGSKVSLFGQGSKKLNYATTGSSGGGDSYDTLKDALEENNRFSVNPDLWNLMDTVYASYGRDYGASSGYTINEAPFSEFTSVQSSFSTYGDAAIVTISRNSGEGSDITAKGTSTEQGAYGQDGSYLSLSDEEIELLTELTKLKNSNTFKSIIVLLNTSSMVQLDFLDNSAISVDACLWVGNLGSFGAYAIGEVLCGEVNPSGRSVDTYLKNNFASPATAYWGLDSDKSVSSRYSNYSDYSLGSTQRNYTVYVEGIYVGYRYFETRYEDYVMGTGNAGSYDYGSEVAFPFGHGESYSEFEYSNFEVTPNYDDDEDETEVVSYTVSVDVANTSDVPGKDVVEVYLQKPYTDKGVETASVELVGYAKTDMLAAAGGEGDSQTVEITVQKEQFRSYDTEGAGTYILDAGDYYLTVANDSHEAVNNVLAAKGYTTSSTSGKMDADGDADFVEKVLSTSAVDTEIFATSSETGEEIVNELDFADMNRYSNGGSNSVTYVSRSDWTGTFPSKLFSFSVSGDAMGVDLQSDVEGRYDMEGYSMPKYGRNNGLTMAMLRGADYDDDDWEDLLDQMTYAEQAELVTLGYHGTVVVESVSKPQVVDENGPTSVTGSVSGYCLPSEGIWAATFNDELIQRVGELMGDDCITSGMQGLYAPGVNIHRSAFCGRSHEYFSEDPYLSGMASAAEIKGIQSRGVIAYVKHFAFNDVETNRNGIGIWLNEQSAREIYLLPFEYSMRPSMGNSHGVMTSFNRAGCKWTSASSELLLDIARGEWGYDGFYITDMSTSNGASYMTYYDGIMNGTNLYDGTPADSLSGYKNNASFCYMLRESCHRIMYNIVNYSAAMNGISSTTRVYAVTNWWQVLIIVLLVIAAVGTVAAIVFYVLAEVFLRKGNGGDGNGGGGVRPRDAEDDYDTSGGVTSSDDIE